MYFAHQMWTSMDADVIIIGGGICGLMVAKQLSEKGKKIILLEADDTYGGRIKTVHSKSFSYPIELGAEFIHGEQTNTLQLLKSYKIPYYKTGGNFLKKKGNLVMKAANDVDHTVLILDKLQKLKTDVSVSEFLEKEFAGELFSDLRESIKRYVEGFSAADVTRYSSLALRTDLEEEGDQFRLKDGYGALITKLVEDCKANRCRLFTSQVVEEVVWRPSHVQVSTKWQTFTAPQLVVTASLGVLKLEPGQTGYIKFSPGIPQLQLVKNLGFGNVVKYIFEIKPGFWKEELSKLLKESGEKDFFFLFTEEEVPTWWTQIPKAHNIVTGWLAGSAAKGIGENEDAILHKGLNALSKILSVKESDLLNAITGKAVFNWKANPHIQGAYTYKTIHHSDVIATFLNGFNNTIFFAGEAFNGSGSVGTVEAALQSAIEVADKITASTI